MTIRIEFYGIPRQRAGVATLDVAARDLGSALELAGRALPGFGAACVEGRRLRAGYLANVNGRAFVSDPEAPLTGGDAVLIFSSDAGG
jgi:molybdopterin converting factor small subunit